MDRRVKERLIGASILVVLIVLIVPELLSGPAPVREGSRLPVSTPEPIRNVTVDLATRQAPLPDPGPAAASATVPTEPPAASTATPAQSPGVPPATPAAESPAPAEATPAPAGAGAAAPLETAVPAPTSVPAGKQAVAGHAWAVQLGSFASRSNADNLAHQVKVQGFAVYVLPGGSGNSLRYRVRIGPMADRAAASQAIAKLKSQGYPASLVPPAT
jgi:DedD protein